MVGEQQFHGRVAVIQEQPGEAHSSLVEAAVVHPSVEGVAASLVDSVVFQVAAVPVDPGKVVMQHQETRI